MIKKHENTLQWQALDFTSLNTELLYQIMALRNAVFIVEQNCPYQDLDGIDQDCIHLLGLDNDKLAAYARILPAQEKYPASIGRLIIAPDYRGQQLAHQLMKHALTWIKNHKTTAHIVISAQSHLTDFYAQHQFLIEGEEYLEDNIPHRRMIHTPKKH